MTTEVSTTIFLLPTANYSTQKSPFLTVEILKSIFKVTLAVFYKKRIFSQKNLSVKILDINLQKYGINFALSCVVNK